MNPPSRSIPEPRTPVGGKIPLQKLHILWALKVGRLSEPVSESRTPVKRQSPVAKVAHPVGDEAFSAFGSGLPSPVSSAKIAQRVPVRSPAFRRKTSRIHFRCKSCTTCCEPRPQGSGNSRSPILYINCTKSVHGGAGILVCLLTDP